MVVFGKLSDLLGRKRVMLVGIAIFLVGSILCGFGVVDALDDPVPARSRRRRRGHSTRRDDGGGRPLFGARERGKIQGYLASVWAISAVVGPLAGGLIIQHFSWAWIFWLNVPIGILAAAGFWVFLHENIAHERREIDHLSAGVFTIAIAAIMADLTAISTSDWTEIGVISALAIVCAGLFVWQERRSPEPMISLKLWGRRPIAAANGASLLAGMTMIGLTTFLPMYVQGAMRQSALTAGFALSVMVLGWPVGATLATRACSRDSWASARCC